MTFITHNDIDGSLIRITCDEMNDMMSNDKIYEIEK